MTVRFSTWRASKKKGYVSFFNSLDIQIFVFCNNTTRDVRNSYNLIKTFPFCPIVVHFVNTYKRPRKNNPCPISNTVPCPKPGTCKNKITSTRGFVCIELCNEIQCIFDALWVGFPITVQWSRPYFEIATESKHHRDVYEISLFDIIYSVIIFQCCVIHPYLTCILSMFNSFILHRGNSMFIFVAFYKIRPVYNWILQNINRW